MRKGGDAFEFGNARTGGWALRGFLDLQERSSVRATPTQHLVRIKRGLFVGAYKEG
jgi:hypothetical protein